MVQDHKIYHYNGNGREATRRQTYKKTHQDFSTHKARKYVNLQWVEITGNIHQKEFNIMEQEQAAIK
jgi:hypothetical protein